MVAYLDSSLVLRHILPGEETIEEAFRCGKVITSELLEIECSRVLHRYRLQGELDDDGFIEGTTVLAMTPSIKQEAAGSFPVVIKTLEYIDTYGPVELEIFSHDTWLNRCAAAMGIQT